MNKKLSTLLITALILTATVSQAEFSLQHGFDRTCESGGTLLFGGLGLFFATIGITIADEHDISAKELLHGRYIPSRFRFPFMQQNYIRYAPETARNNIILSIASFAMLAALCISNGNSPTTI